MPLQEYFPVIDDRPYDTLVAEARSRIPRYTPEWTDLNDTDPGMVLVQLFAWLSEMQLFRLNRVPELHYLKFLELIGVELESAKAARALITFPMLPTFSKSSVIVPAKTQIGSEAPDDQGPIIFETDRAFTAIRASLDHLLADDGFNFRDITTDNQDTQSSFFPFGPAAVADNALMLGFSETLPDTHFHLYVWVPLKQGNTLGGQVPVVSQCFSALDTQAPARLLWEYWNGVEWRPLTLLKDESLAFTRSGELQLKGPARNQMVAAIFGDVASPRFWIRARIISAGYQETPKILAIRTNTTAVTQAETIEREPVGGSNGEMDQVLRLRYAPVIAGSLLLHVDEGDGYQPWQEVVDLYGSGPEDPHFVLNRPTGEIRFGDGTHGRVPVANALNRHNIRAVIYRVGGGKRGNLGAEKIAKLMDSVEGIRANAVMNLFEAGGGSDEETLDAAMKRAPHAMKSRERAVTAEDYEELALRSTNIARAKALPLYHPHFPNLDVPGTVTVIAIPDIDGPAPVPTETTLQAVCAYLNQRRLLTTELFVMGPTYKTVTVKASLVVDNTADLADVKSRALESLELYFHPLHGGENSKPEKPLQDPARSGGGWPFGGDVYYSLLYRRLLFAGVQRIISLEVELDGEAWPACQDIPVGKGVLLVSGAHTIEVNYEVDV